MPMSKTLLSETIDEAVRFINRAQAAKDRMQDEVMACYGCKETAAARRASLDLTRALARLRSR